MGRTAACLGTDRSTSVCSGRTERTGCGLRTFDPGSGCPSSLPSWEGGPGSRLSAGDPVSTLACAPEGMAAMGHGYRGVMRHRSIRLSCFSAAVEAPGEPWTKGLCDVHGFSAAGELPRSRRWAAAESFQGARAVAVPHKTHSPRCTAWPGHMTEGTEPISRSENRGQD